MNAQQRTDRARTAAAARWAGVTDRRAAAEPLWSASPTGLGYWLARADPNGDMDPVERQAYAEHLRREYQRRLALSSARSRAERRSQR